MHSVLDRDESPATEFARHDDGDSLDNVYAESNLNSEQESVSSLGSFTQAISAPHNPCFSFQPHKLFYGLSSILSIQPDDGERAELSAYVTVPQFVQYCVWRRWLMALLIPFVLADFIWVLNNNIVELNHVVSTETLTSVLVTPLFRSYTIYMDVTEISILFLQLCLLCASFYCSHQWRRSRRFLTCSFALPYVFAFIQFLLPIRSLLGTNFVDVASDMVATEIDDWFKKHINSSVTPLPPWQADMYTQMAERMVDEFQSSVLQDLLQKFFFIYFNLQIFINYLKSTGPASLCLLPAVARGAILVKKLFPQSAEMGWLTRIVPVLFTPLIGFMLLLLVQCTASYMVMGAAVSLIVALLVPSLFLMGRLVHRADSPEYFACQLSTVSYVRIVLVSAFITLMIVYIAATKEAQDFISDNIHIKELARFILEFLVKYNLLSILSADWLIEVVISLFDPNLIESSITIPTVTKAMSYLRCPVDTRQALVLAAARLNSFQGRGDSANRRQNKERTDMAANRAPRNLAALSQASIYNSPDEMVLEGVHHYESGGKYCCMAPPAGRLKICESVATGVNNRRRHRGDIVEEIG